MFLLQLTGEQIRGVNDEAGKQTEGVSIHEDGLGESSATIGWTERARRNLKESERHLSARVAAAAAAAAAIAVERELKQCLQFTVDWKPIERVAAAAGTEAARNILGRYIGHKTHERVRFT